MNDTNFELMKETDEIVGVKEHKWYGKEDQTDEKLMHDKGSGEPVIIRLFEFKFPPTLEVLPTKEQILTPEYLKYLNVQLWSDSLRLVMEPRVVIDKTGCKIFAPCQARAGATLMEEPKTLQEWIR
jgi:hypothetical protein